MSNAKDTTSQVIVKDTKHTILFHVSTSSIKDGARHVQVKWELERAGIPYVEVGLWVGNKYHMALMVNGKNHMIVKSYLWEVGIDHYFELRDDNHMLSIRKVAQHNNDVSYLEYENLIGRELFILDPAKEGYNLSLEVYEKDGSSHLLQTVPNVTKERTSLLQSYFGFGVEQ